MKKKYDDFLDPEDGMFEDDCPLIPMVLDTIFSVDKPLGMNWHDDKIERFLSARGYIILEIKDEEGEIHHVAVKSDDPCIPDVYDEEGDVIEVFKQEMQEVLINWLIKLSDSQNGK